MTPRRFARLLDTHGADPARWPQACRGAALALLDSSAEARAMRDAAAALDAALRSSLPQPDPAALARMRNRLAHAVAREPLPVPERRLLRWLRPLAPFGAGALVTLMVCGLWLGLPAAPEPDDILGAPRLMAMMELP
jgi:hypothetical protein